MGSNDTGSACCAAGGSRPQCCQTDQPASASLGTRQVVIEFMYLDLCRVHSLPGERGQPRGGHRRGRRGARGRRNRRGRAQGPRPDGRASSRAGLRELPHHPRQRAGPPARGEGDPLRALRRPGGRARGLPGLGLAGRGARRPAQSDDRRCRPQRGLRRRAIRVPGNPIGWRRTRELEALLRCPAPRRERLLLRPLRARPLLRLAPVPAHPGAEPGRYRFLLRLRPHPRRQPAAAKRPPNP